MISKIFEFYYTTNLYPIRLKPLTPKELERGMSSEAVEQYLSLVEQLYNAFYFDVNAEFTPLPVEIRHQKGLVREKIYNAIIKLLFMHDAISDDAYCELHKLMPIEFNFIEHPSIPQTYISDSLDDFRLAFEYCLVENDEYTDLSDNYLDDQYGYSVCVRPNTPSGLVTSKDLQVIRYESSESGLHSIDACLW